MKLIVQELKTTLQQELTAPKTMLLEAVRPHLYRHNHPAGTLQVQVLDASDVVVGTSNSINIADIGSQAFFHGQVRFDMTTGLKKNQAYKVKLVPTGYTFSESAYIAWVNDFDSRIYDASPEPTNSVEAPLAIELFERTTR